MIRVLDDTYLVFDSMTATTTGSDTVTETLLDLKKGSIFGSVKKQAAASRFEVKIPNGVAGIRGTVFLIKASGLVSCLQGSVVAAYTTAAGDAFCGALAVRKAEGADFREAVRFAVAASAISVTRVGAQPSLPTRAEVEALVAG